MVSFWQLLFTYIRHYIQTVKYFNNEAFEVEKYDEYLKSKFLCYVEFGTITLVEQLLPFEFTYWQEKTYEVCPDLQSIPTFGTDRARKFNFVLSSIFYFVFVETWNSASSALFDNA